MKKVIGLTGGVASGKSAVAKFFQKQGADVIKADLIGHVIQQNQATIEEITAEFGDVLDIYGRISRKKLGNIVFNDPSKLKKLNEIMHPKMKKLMKKFIEDSEAEIVILEMAILFEAGFDDLCDEVVVVYADETVQLARLAYRDISEEKAHNIIDSQMDVKEKIKLANYVIQNNSTIYNLKNKVRHLYEYLIKEK